MSSLAQEYHMPKDSDGNDEELGECTKFKEDTPTGDKEKSNESNISLSPKIEQSTETIPNFGDEELGEYIKVEEDTPTGDIEKNNESNISPPTKIEQLTETTPNPAANIDGEFKVLSRNQRVIYKKIVANPVLGSVFVFVFIPFFIVGLIFSTTLYILYSFFQLCLGGSVFLISCCCDQKIPKCSEYFDCSGQVDFVVGFLQLAISIGLALLFLSVWLPVSVILVIPFDVILFCCTPWLFIQPDRDVYSRYTMTIPSWFKAIGFGVPSYSYDDEENDELHGSLLSILSELFCSILLFGLQLIFYPVCTFCNIFYSSDEV